MFHCTQMTRISLLLLIAVSAAAQEGAPPRKQAADTAQQSPLPRRGSAGIGIAGEAGRIVIRDVFPNTAAEKAGLQKDDVLLSIDGKPVATPADFTGPLSRRTAGEKVTVGFERGGEKRTATLTLLERLREKSDAYDVTYGEVSDGTHRYRTIHTKPKTGTPAATLFLVQGLGCGSIDNPPPGHSYPLLIATLSRHGFATLRVDKPGVGDSEGGPCPAVDFHGEVRAFRAALASIKDQNVFLLGHSMGGIQAPLIAQGFPLRGVMVYGSTFNSWAQYMVSNQRRQMRLRGESFENIQDAERFAEELNALFYVQKVPFEKILADHPKFREAFPDGKTFAGGKEGKFFQQLYDMEAAKEWKKIEAPVLAIYGASDFLTDASEHESLAAAVNSWRPGTAKFVQLQGIDHWLRKADDQAASLRQGPGGSEYNELLAETVAAFMKEHAAR